MANKKQVAILKKGVDAWDAWREKNKEVWVDLRQADLTGADLRGANLFWANLYEADLTEANLTGANLSRANLERANLYEADLTEANLTGANLSRANLNEANLRGALLSEADLTRANLRGANLRDANLTGANLTSADLFGADLIGADLTRANLRGAHLFWANLTWASLREAYFQDTTLLETVFADTDLTGTKGLDQCDHWGPSTLDHRTLAQSGTLPLVFLRGCGLPDFIIDNIEVLRGDPIQFYSCFISYSSDDDAFTRRLHADLQDTGVRCWFAPEDLKTGDEIRPAIDSAIRLRDKLLLILSEHSIGSEWVKDEVESAYEEEARRGKTILFPIRLDDAVLETDESWAAKLRRQRHIGDFTHWKDHDHYATSFHRLLRDLKA